MRADPLGWYFALCNPAIEGLDLQAVMLRHLLRGEIFFVGEFGHGFAPSPIPCLNRRQVSSRGLSVDKANVKVWSINSAVSDSCGSKDRYF